MNILFLTQRVPYPPNKGDKLRAFHTIKYLAKNHQVHLMSLSDNSEDFAFRDILLKDCESVAFFRIYPWLQRLLSPLALLFLKPLTLFYFYSRSLQREVGKILNTEKIDMVYVYCSSMAPYCIHNDKVAKIIDFVDVDSDKWKQYAKSVSFVLRYIYWYEYWALKRFEKQISEVFDGGIVVAEPEKVLLEIYCKNFPIVAIPNGVDIEFFTYQYKKPEPYIIFTGNLDYYPNVDAVLYFRKEIWPKILLEKPNLKFRVVGRNPDQMIIALNGKDNIELCSDVADIRPWVKHAMVSVAPMRIARGIQNKVLEAMAMGIPVVCSALALEGLRAKPNQELLVSDDASDFADKVIRLISNTELSEKLSRQGRMRIEASYIWANNLKKIEDVFARIKAKQTKNRNGKKDYEKH